MEYFDEYDEAGRPSGRIVSREEAHRQGLWHRTAHIWVICGQEVLIQKRADDKDSYPGYYDISSAGHLGAGEDVLDGALREVHEELGLEVKKEQLILIGHYRINYERSFHEHMFRDREHVSVFVISLKNKDVTFHIQKEELSEVKWISIQDCQKNLLAYPDQYCINHHDMERLSSFLKSIEFREGTARMGDS